MLFKALLNMGVSPKIILRRGKAVGAGCKPVDFGSEGSNPSLHHSIIFFITWSVLGCCGCSSMVER